GTEGTVVPLTVGAVATEAGAASTAFTTATLHVTVSEVAEAPTFGGSTSFSGDEGKHIALSGVTVSTADSDDTLGATATISGISSGWTLYDGTTALGNGTQTVPMADLTAGLLSIVAPSPGSAVTDSLTLTVSSHEGSSTS